MYSPDTKVYLIHGDHDTPAFRQQGRDYNQVQYLQQLPYPLTLNLTQQAYTYSPDTKVYLIHGDHDTPAFRQQGRDYNQVQYLQQFPYPLTLNLTQQAFA